MRVNLLHIVDEGRVVDWFYWCDRGVTVSIARGWLTHTPVDTIANGRNVSATSLASVATAWTTNTSTSAKLLLPHAEGPILSRFTDYCHHAINVLSFKRMNQLLTGVITRWIRKSWVKGERRGIKAQWWRIPLFLKSQRIFITNWGWLGIRMENWLCLVGIWQNWQQCHGWCMHRWREGCCVQGSQ